MASKYCFSEEGPTGLESPEFMVDYFLYFHSDSASEISFFLNDLSKANKKSLENLKLPECSSSIEDLENHSNKTFFDNENQLDQHLSMQDTLNNTINLMQEHPNENKSLSQSQNQNYSNTNTIFNNTLESNDKKIEEEALNTPFLNDNFNFFDENQAEEEKLQYQNKSTSTIKVYKNRRSRSPKRVLNKFIDNPNSNSKKPKKGNTKKSIKRDHPKSFNYDLKCIRRWVKYLFNLRQNKGLHISFNFKIHDQEYSVEFKKNNQDYMVNFRKHYQMHANDLNEVPEQFRRLANKDNQFNGKNIKDLFLKPSLKESYELFIIDFFESLKICEEISRNKDSYSTLQKWCSALCKFFVFNCCDSKNHNENCEQIWIELRNNTYTKFIINERPSS